MQTRFNILAILALTSSVSATGPSFLRGLTSSSSTCDYVPDSWASTIDLGGGAWTISGDTVRFDFEDSSGCGGPEIGQQKGTATNTIDAGCGAVLDLDVTGLVEDCWSGFDILSVYVDGVQIFGASGQSGPCDCAMIEPQINLDLTPYTLSAGTHAIEVVADTRDSLEHLDAFYEVQFSVTSMPVAVTALYYDGQELVEGDLDGATVCVSDGINIEAILDGDNECAEDVKFELFDSNGQKIKSHKEGNPKWFMCGNSGDTLGRCSIPDNEDYTLVVTPDDGCGATPTEISFSTGCEGRL